MTLFRLLGLAAIAIIASEVAPLCADDLTKAVESALTGAGDNKDELRKALDQVADERSEGIKFLIAHMPQRDLTGLSAEFLLENVDLAYRAWNEAAWKDRLPKDVFLNDVLPYASINERRDGWRRQFYEQLKPLVKDAKSPAEAAALLNQKVFPLLKVRYSTKRAKADQSPLESIESGLASCTGLSVLLVDACRAVGVPARFVGTPLWTNKSGNHSWVEIWDDGWHFTGAAEPTGNDLNRGWFVGRASTAQRDHPLHAIYAVSFRKTPQHFPLVWDRKVDYISAVNVTDRYTRLNKKLPEGSINVMFRAFEQAGGERCSAKLRVTDSQGDPVFEGATNDERFDANDHIVVTLPRDQTYTVEATYKGVVVKRQIAARTNDELFSFELNNRNE